MWEIGITQNEIDLLFLVEYNSFHTLHYYFILTSKGRQTDITITEVVLRIAIVW